MGTTATLNLPFPELDGENNPPADIKALADTLNAYLLAPPTARSGKTTVTIPAGATSSAPLAVTFSKAFSAAPYVSPGAVSTAPYGATLGAEPTATGFTVVAHRPSGASTTAAVNLSVHWIAIGPA